MWMFFKKLLCHEWHRNYFPLSFSFKSVDSFFSNNVLNQVTNSKTALITGSAKRIGREIALELAHLGFDLAVHYNNSGDQALSLKKEIEDLGVKCTLIKADLFDEKQVDDLLGKMREIKNWSLLINNASIFSKSNFMETDLQDFENNFTVHLKVPLNPFHFSQEKDVLFG